MNYTVDDLFLFAQITNYHSLNDAAKDLGYTPSFLTRFVQKLEAALGHPLIITTRNGFIPSYFGNAISSRFGAYNELFNLEVVNSLSVIGKYKANFNIFLTSTSADFVIRDLLKLAK